MPDSTGNTSWCGRFAHYDKKFCFSLLGCIISVVFGIAGIWYGVSSRMSADLQIDILSDTNIVDIGKDSDKLDILYNGKSIKSAGSTLSVITFRIVNFGNAPIRLDSFPPDAPLGIVLSEGEIVDVPQAIAASSDHLPNEMKATCKDARTVLFAPAVMRPGDFIDFRLLVIHGDSSKPIDIKSIGVSGDVKEVPVRRPFDPPRYLPKHPWL
jgi:hypothetical protein